MIGHISAIGSISEYGLPSDASGATGITVGSDGSTWVAATDATSSHERIVRRLPDGGYQGFEVPTAQAQPWYGGITEGSDGNIWFTEFTGGKIGRLTPTGVLTEFASPTGNSSQFEITSGSDGALWFTQSDAKRQAAVGRITTAGNVSIYPISGGAPDGITAGSDKRLWFTQREDHRIGRISTTGVVRYFQLASDSLPTGIAAGADGALWFTDGANVGSITTGGHPTLTSLPQFLVADPSIAASANGSIWFTDLSDSKIGRIEPGAIAPPGSYVALGDSYSSGEGNPPYEPGTNSEEGIPDLCHRSPAAYGPILDRALVLGTMTFKACSGAVTNDFFRPSAANLSEPAQLNWLRPNTKTVTLTIGGNDAGFAHVLEECVSLPPIKVGFGCSTNRQLEVETQARLSALAGGSYATAPPPLSQPIHSVLSVIQAIHTDAPSARILIGLYPKLFGQERSHYSVYITAPGMLACEVGLNMWVDYKDAQWLNKLGGQLNTDITGAVKTARSKGIAITPVTPSAFASHRFCDEGERWFYPLELELRNPFEAGTEIVAKSSSFHPTETGQLLAYEAAFAVKLK